jgi:hypothetical protein
LRIRLERHQWWREAGQLDVAVGRCSGSHQCGLHRPQHVLAPHWPARTVKHGTIRRRCRPPVHAELPRDGAKLRRLHHDPAAGTWAGTQHAIGIGTGLVEQVGQPHH